MNSWQIDRNDDLIQTLIEVNELEDKFGQLDLSDEEKNQVQDSVAMMKGIITTKIGEDTQRQIEKTLAEEREEERKRKEKQA